MEDAKPLKHAQTLKREANYVLERVKVNQILASYGRVTATGSYFLDTMVYPDIDLYLSKVSIPTLFEIGGKLASHDLTTEIVFEKSRLTALPGGLYLKARFDYGEWGRPWKLDIWSLEDSLIEERVAETTRLQMKMTAALRERIIQYKLSVMTEAHRTPRFSGYFIYKAFLDEGLRDFEAVTRYLVENGIEMG